MNIASKAKTMIVATVLLPLALSTSQIESTAASTSPPAPTPSVMTLAHLKNASYAIPDLTCGYRNIKLKNGVGENDGIQAQFGRAAFGSLRSLGGTSAVVHMAYHDESLGWLQQLIFVETQKDRLVQIAEYSLDDREELTNLEIVNGEAVVATQMPGANDTSKLTRIRVSQSARGCMLKASEWQKNKITGRLQPFTDMRPYLYTVEDRIGKFWAPTQKDRGEHVTVTFKIKPSGDIEDVRVASSSEIKTADTAALEAVENAAPFAPLPASETNSLNLCFEFQAGVNVRQDQTHRQ